MTVNGNFKYVIFVEKQMCKRIKIFDCKTTANSETHSWKLIQDTINVAIHSHNFAYTYKGQ